MVSLTNEEEALVVTLVECLAHAVARHDDVDSSDLNKTKVQKFTYLASQQFDLSLTYSWYLAGSLVESDSASPSALSTKVDELPKTTESSIDTANEDEQDDPDKAATRSLEEPTDSLSQAPADIQREFELEQEADPQIDTSEADKLEEFDDSTFDFEETITDDDFPSHPDIPIEDCIEYFVEELDTYPLHPTDRFLQQFYTYHAPDGYKQLYTSCLHVRSSLRALSDAVELLAVGTTPVTNIEQIEIDLNRHISRVHLELADNEQLKETLPAVLQGTDLIEDAVLKLKQLPSSELTEAHVDAIDQLQMFYFQWVWKYPALKISAETATGPSADRISQSRNRTFDSFDPKLDRQRDQTRRTLDSVGLLPDYEDYPDLEQTETNQAIVEFTNTYINE